MNFRICLKTITALFWLILGVDALAQGTKIRPNNGESTPGYTLGPTLSNADVQKSYDTDEESYTELVSTASVGVAISPYLSLKYTNNVPASSPFYAKIKMNDSQLLDYVVGGVVGNALNTLIAGLVGGVPNTEFEFLNSSGNSVFSAETKSFNTVDVNKFRFVQDGLGNYYARFLPGVAFTTFKSRLYTVGVVVSGKYTRFYDTFYYESNGSCPKNFTYINASADLLTAVGNSAPVANPKNAIDNDLESYSTFGNQGLINLGLGKTIEQVVELPSVITTKKVQLKMMMPHNLLGVGVGSGVKVVFYRGNQVLKEVDVDRNILSLDVLGLINSNSNVPFTVTIDPPVVAGTQNIDGFDKIGVKISQPVNLNVGSINGDLRLYDVSLVDKNPTVVKACAKIFPFPTGGGFVKKFDITQVIPNFNSNNFAQYAISDFNNNSITFSSVSDLQSKKWQPFGTYLVKGIQGANFCSDQYYSYEVQEGSAYTIVGETNIPVLQGSSLDFSTLSFSSTIGGAPQIFDESNNANVTNTTKVFNEIGTYNYYVKASSTSGDCEVLRRMKIYVYDGSTCDYRYTKKLANSESVGTVSLLGIPLGGSYYSANAVDSDLSTFSQIFNGISLLGIGTTWQNLNFDTVISKGTPVTVKLGQGYSILQALGGITLRALDANGSPVGKLVDIGETDLLNALVGDNIFEFTFVPTDNNGQPIDFKGVRVNLGSLLGVGNIMNIYGAYVEQKIPIANASCQGPIVVNGITTPQNTTNPPTGKATLNATSADVTWGVEDIGVGAATALSGVINPYLAIDSSYEYSSNGTLTTVSGIDSHATFNTAVSILNKQKLMVKLKEVTRPGDQLRIIIGSENVGVLNLNILGGFKIQRYLGDAPVGNAVTNSEFGLIELNLLGLLGSTANKYAIMVSPSPIPFDRVEISFTNVATVQLLGEYTYIYDVAVVPSFNLDMDANGHTVCVDKVFDMAKIDACSTFDLSIAYKQYASNSTPQNPIFEWVDIPQTQFTQVYEGNASYRYRVPYTPAVRAVYNAKLQEVFNGTLGNLYLKITSKRQNCIYGEPQYVKISRIGKCFGMLSNPMIKNRTSPY